MKVFITLPETSRKIEFTVKVMGGEGSGNWSHAGRPGEVGGSAPEGSGGGGLSNPVSGGLGLSSNKERADLAAVVLHDLRPTRSSVMKRLNPYEPARPMLDRMSSSDAKAVLESMLSEQVGMASGPAVNRVLGEGEFTTESLDSLGSELKDSTSKEVYPSFTKVKIRDMWHAGMLTSRLNKEDARGLLSSVLKDTEKVANQDIVDSLAIFAVDPEVRSEAVRHSTRSTFEALELPGNTEDWRKAAITEWTIQYGTPGAYRMQQTARHIAGNKGKMLYNGSSNGYPLAQTMPSQESVKAMEGVYQKTQDFFKAKGITKLKVYRGVGTNVVTHAPLESWTLDPATAKRFAKMMDDSGGGGYVVEKEVPIESVFWSWQTERGDWPEERELKGKKEVTLLGGML